MSRPSLLDGPQPDWTWRVRPQAKDENWPLELAKDGFKLCGFGKELPCLGSFIIYSHHFHLGLTRLYRTLSSLFLCESQLGFLLGFRLGGVSHRNGLKLLTEAQVEE